MNFIGSILIPRCNVPEQMSVWNHSLTIMTGWYSGLEDAKRKHSWCYSNYPYIGDDSHYCWLYLPPIASIMAMEAFFILQKARCPHKHSQRLCWENVEKMKEFKLTREILPTERANNISKISQTKQNVLWKHHFKTTSNTYFNWLQIWFN